MVLSKLKIPLDLKTGFIRNYNEDTNKAYFFEVDVEHFKKSTYMIKIIY